MGVSAPPGPPIPYWPSVVVKPETIRGVGTYYTNLILDIIFGICALVIGLSAVLAASASTPAAAIGLAAALGAAACGLIIVFVINFIVSLMSVLHMHHGADEYGPEHAVNASRGIVFKWIGTSLSTGAAILVAYLVIGGTGAFVTGGGVSATVFVPLLITVFWTAGVGAKAQMYRYMVRSLQPPETRQWSDIASILIPVLGIVGVAVVGVFTVRVVDLLSNPSPTSVQEASRILQLMIGGVFLPPGLALVGYVVFLVIYARTKERLGQGLKHLYAGVPPPQWGPAPVMPPVSPIVMTPLPVGPVAPPPGTGFCGRCGFPIPAAAVYCPNCGTQARVSA
ncbi:MAG TPA: zinc ribbon domain-containing protein [Thermoplasmata archaeon]|nr:zinc ribbon domain-containing protein [Thermoplasmata archaeon]